jgi:hypothetical protein
MGKFVAELIRTECLEAAVLQPSQHLGNVKVGAPKTRTESRPNSSRVSVRRTKGLPSEARSCTLSTLNATLHGLLL